MASLTISPIPTAPAAPVTRDVEDLVELLMRVARRADALSGRRRGKTRAGDRRLWLRAESEVFDHSGNPVR